MGVPEAWWEVTLLLHARHRCWTFLAGNERAYWVLGSLFKTPEEDKGQTQEVTSSLANAKELSVGAAAAAVLSPLLFVFFLLCSQLGV